MLPQPDHEVLASGQIQRQRSRLFGPLVLLVAVAAVVVGYQTFVSVLSEATDPLADEIDEPLEQVDEEGSWACLGPIERDERLGSLDRDRADFSMVMARSEWVVEGMITDGLLDDGFGVTVEEVVVVRGRIPGGLQRLDLPLADLPERPPWQGARFVAFLSDIDRAGNAAVVPGGFFFACDAAAPAASLAVMEDADTAAVANLTSIKRSYDDFARFADPHPTLNVAPRIYALDINTYDNARIGVFLPERLADRFNVWELDEEETWPLVFANNTVVGRIGTGPCRDRRPEHCSGNLRMDIESLSGVEVPASLVFLGGPSEGPMQQAFARPVAAELEAPQPVGDGELLLYQSEGTLFAVGKESLEPHWSYGGGGSTLEWLGGTPERIVVRSRSLDTLSGLRSDGTVAWRYRTAGTVLPGLWSESPILIQSWVYAGGDSRQRVLVALDPENGRELWEFSATVPALGAAAVDDRSGQNLFVLEIVKEEPLSSRKDFVGLDADTGEVRWRANDRPGGGVYEIDGFLWWAGGGALARIDGETGEPMWRVDRGGIGSLTIEGSVVDLGTAGSYDLDTGRRLRDAAVSPCC